VSPQRAVSLSEQSSDDGSSVSIWIASAVGALLLLVAMTVMLMRLMKPIVHNVAVEEVQVSTTARELPTDKASKRHPVAVEKVQVSTTARELPTDKASKQHPVAVEEMQVSTTARELPTDKASKQHEQTVASPTSGMTLV
jgi:hypothetical protein